MGRERKLSCYSPTLRGDSLRTCGLICYESIYPELVAEFVRRGADFLTIITNDGWFGKSTVRTSMRHLRACAALKPAVPWHAVQIQASHFSLTDTDADMAKSLGGKKPSA